MIISVLRWTQFAFAAERFDREISRIGTTLPLAILIVGVIGMGFAYVTFVDALISERHSAAIEFIILIRKNLCSEFVSEEKSHEKELFAEIKSLIFTNLSLLYVFCTLIFLS